jgi:tRNA pseudouridine55 synthase
VCLGEATKFSHSLLDADKSYEATIRLGFLSSTGDAEGIIEPFGDPQFSDAKLRQTLRSFTGTIYQVPPMHSALKRLGRPLYAYARAGEDVQRQSREVVIRELEVSDFSGTTVSIRVSCSKGTYIRVLAEDIGKALGCGGYLLALRRTGIGNLDINGAIGLDALTAMDGQVRAARLLPVDRLVDGLPAVHLDENVAKRVVNGVAAEVPGVGIGPVRLYDSTGTFLGVGEGRSGGVVVPKRMISNQAAPENESASV